MIREKSGEVASRVMEDVQSLERGLLDGSEQGITAVLQVLGITAMLFWLQPSLAWLVVLPIPVLLLMMRNHWQHTRKNWKTVRESAGELNSLLVEDIQGNRLIQSFALQEREHRRFMLQANDLREKTLKAMYRWSFYNPLANFVGTLGIVAVVGMGGWLIMQDAMTPGALLAYFIYAGMLYEPLNRLHGLNHMLAAATASGKRVFEVLDHPVDIEDAKDPVPYPAATLPRIVYHDVHFAYQGRDTVLDHLNLELPAGKMTALVGHTGAGKSTIANLLLRYYDVSGGAVSINGVDVRAISLKDLRSHIGYVAQDPFLFDGTVLQNMVLAAPDATEDQVIAALEGARAWDFVSKLPNGLNTQIGERGIRLSMGEKQRLTIARVLLKNPTLLIFDEATSSVDTETERYIQEAIDNLMTGRTVLVIAHRLSTVRKADQIVVLEHGRILEQGSHEALMERQGHYAKLWSYQNDWIPTAP
ncbi:MAG: ABC transporter ATP-binding protein/permease [Verrucomicrobia bacterium]|nr:ABC transporter ATP-binding protein/permease [Verrucomicrobiota bacterium]